VSLRRGAPEIFHFYKCTLFVALYKIKASALRRRAISNETSYKLGQ
jgi:hypothetical protein